MKNQGSKPSEVQKRSKPSTESMAVATNERDSNLVSTQSESKTSKHKLPNQSAAKPASGSAKKPAEKPRSVTEKSTMKVKEVVEKTKAPEVTSDPKVTSNIQQVESGKPSSQAPSKIQRKDKTI